MANHSCDALQTILIDELKGDISEFQPNRSRGEFCLCRYNPWFSFVNEHRLTLNLPQTLLDYTVRGGGIWDSKEKRETLHL